MSAVLERLRTLRAETGALARALAEPEPAPRAFSEQYLETRATLSRLLGLRGARLASTQRTATPSLHAAGTALPGTALADGLRLVECTWRDDAFACPRLDASRGALRFIDTETTGLAGGTGTLAFVLALARWQPDGLHVRQLLLTRPGAEAAMLIAFRDWLTPGDELVSYNGRSFDAPLLRTRFRLHGLDDPLAGLAHHDLLHEVRRRHRREWENCRLLTAERRLLGVARHDDLPGSEAPGAWRHFLACGDSTPLRRVLDHNRQDLVSLALIADRLQSIDGKPAP